MDLKFRGYYKNDITGHDMLFDIECLIFRNGDCYTNVPNVGEVKCIKFSNEYEINKDSKDVILMQKVLGQEFFEGDVLSYYECGSPLDWEPSYYIDYVVIYDKENCKFVFKEIYGDETSWDADDTDYDKIVGNIFEPCYQKQNHN